MHLERLINDVENPRSPTRMRHIHKGRAVTPVPRLVLLLLLLDDLSGGVKSDLDSVVGERVLVGALLGVSLLLGSQDGLDLVGVDDSVEIRVGHHGLGHSVSLLGPDGIELLEGILGVDHESTQRTTRGYLEEVEAGNVADLNTRDVSEGLHVVAVTGVHNQGTTTHGVLVVAALANTGAADLGGLDTLDLLSATESGEELHSLLGLGDLLNSGVNDEGDLGDSVDFVAAGHDKGSHRRGRDGGSQSVSPFGHVDLSVPSSPGLGGGVHATATAHVAESTLSGAVSATTGNTGNTGDSAASTPGLSRGLVAGVHRDTISLTGVFGHLGVDVTNVVGADGRLADSGHSHGAGDLRRSSALVHGNSSAQHTCGVEHSL